MKNFLFCIFILSSFVLNAQTSFIFKGNFSDIKDTIVTLSGIGFKQKINVRGNGDFCDTFFIPYNGRYQMEQAQLYLEQNKSLSIQGEYQSYSLWNYTGELALENTYFLKKKELLNRFYFHKPSYFQSKEHVFLSILDSMVIAQSNLRKSLRITNDSLLKYDSLDLMITKKYFEWLYYANPKMIKSRSKFDKKLLQITSYGIENEKLYSYSYYYKSYCEKILLKPSKDFQPDEQFTAEQRHAYAMDYLIKRRKNVSNRLLRDDFGYYIIFHHGKSTDSDTWIDEIVSDTKNDLIREQLLLEKWRKNQLQPGMPSPSFHYVNYDGDSVRLEDFRGKLLFIDVWATWCSPCLQEMQAFEMLRKQYQDKNIAFITISIDFPKDYEKWRQKVEEKEIQKIALLADKNWQSDFMQAYHVRSIPRFIIIDKEGKIIHAWAPSPSNKLELEKIIDAYLE